MGSIPIHPPTLTYMKQNNNLIGKLCYWGYQSDVQKENGLIIPLKYIVLESYGGQTRYGYLIYATNRIGFWEASEESLNELISV